MYNRDTHKNPVCWRAEAFINMVRCYSSALGAERPKDNGNYSLNPNFVTGFIDAEGSFIISVQPVQTQFK